MADRRDSRKKHWGLAFILIAVMLICGFIYWKTILLEDDLAEKNQQKEFLNILRIIKLNF